MDIEMYRYSTNDKTHNLRLENMSNLKEALRNYTTSPFLVSNSVSLS